jgi:hypothetical protein
VVGAMRTVYLAVAALTALSGSGALAQSYDDLARQPSAYVGTIVNFKGKVVQALESGGKYLLRVNVTKKPYNIWSDTVLVQFRASPSGGRLLEGDIINFRGRSAGITSYTAVLGQTIQLPSVAACEISDAASPFITVPGPCDTGAEIKILQMSRRSQDEEDRRAKEAEEGLKQQQSDLTLNLLKSECKQLKQSKFGECDACFSGMSAARCREAQLMRGKCDAARLWNYEGPRSRDYDPYRCR